MAFDRATEAKLSASQVNPILSMLGVTGRAVDLVENLFSTLGG